MRAPNFGWSYPAGAENDPNAPWNQVDPEDVEFDELDDPEDSESLTGLFSDLDNPFPEG